MHRLAFSFAAIATLSIAACSGGDSVGTDSSEVVGDRTWKLSPDAVAAGRVVRLEYDAAPIWTGTSTCAGKLRSGTRDVGVFLSGRFRAIDTVGGYACRRNTADSKRMSVHGTGRALDLMISTVKGEADTTHGDPIADYLVMNAEKIGIQLIIWNHTVWRANGTNTAPYTGPIPHIDHIHVELTNDAAKRATAWFETSHEDGGDDASTTDDDAGSTIDDDPDAGDFDYENDDASTMPPDGDVDAASTDPTPAPDAAPPPPDAAAPAPQEPQPQNGGDSYSLELPDDEPAPQDALGPKSKHAYAPPDDAAPSTASHGCNAAPVGPANGALALGLVAVVIAAAARRRR